MTAAGVLALFGGEPIELVVLDMMGTTVVDGGQVTRALAAALERHGLDPSGARASDWRGASKREAIRRLVAAAPDQRRLAGVVYGTFRRLLRDAGHNAGVRWNIGVLSGAHSRRQLAAAPHTHLVGSADELLGAAEGSP